MADKCPYCYRILNIGTFRHDPILLPNGAKYDWIDNTNLVMVTDTEDRWYKGFQQINLDDIIEIQDALKEIENTSFAEGDRTSFSSLNSNGYFQITGYHIKEMRGSVEKILTASGMTKQEYFNYDEDNNHIIHPEGDKLDWTDAITESTDLQNFQVKFIHIEDLRHMLEIVLFDEDWRLGTSSPAPISDSETYIPPPMTGEFARGKAFISGRIYAENNWYRESMCLLSQGAGHSGANSCAYTFTQNPAAKNITLAANIGMSAEARMGSVNYVAGTFNHLVTLSDTLLSVQSNNKMKIRLTNTSCSGGNYYGILELSATICFKNGGVTYVAVVFASIAGEHQTGVMLSDHYYYLDDAGYLCSDPGSGGALWFRMQRWQELTSGTFKIADIIEKEYGYNAEDIDIIRIWGITMYSACVANASDNLPPASSYFGGSGSINLQLGHMVLIA